MSQTSIFADEWRECLRVHYMDVCRRDDRRTDETLTRVMLEIGFNDDELNELRVRATMRDMPTDFVPDMLQQNEDTGIEQSTEDAVGTQFIASAPAEPESLSVEDTIIDEETLEEDSQAESSEPDDPDAPEQLSLF